MPIHGRPISVGSFGTRDLDTFLTEKDAVTNAFEDGPSAISSAFGNLRLLFVMIRVCNLPHAEGIRVGAKAAMAN